MHNYKKDAKPHVLVLHGHQSYASPNYDRGENFYREKQGGTDDYEQFHSKG